MSAVDSVIYKELPADMVRRMRNWARWNSGSGVTGLGTHPMWRTVPSGCRGESSIGVISGEAGDTESALQALPARYGQAVRLFWQYEGQAVSYLARRCACDYRTYVKRVAEGHVMLRSEILRRSDEAKMQRERFEAAACLCVTT